MVNRKFKSVVILIMGVGCSLAFYQNCGGFKSQTGDESPKATATDTNRAVGRPIMIAASFSANDARENVSYVLVTGSNLLQTLQFRFQPDGGGVPILGVLSSNSNTALTLRFPGATYDRIGRIQMESSSTDMPQLSNSITIPKIVAGTSNPTPTPTMAGGHPSPTPTMAPAVSPTPVPTPTPECNPGQTQLVNGSGTSYGYSCSRTGMYGQGQSAQCSCHDELKQTCGANGFWGFGVATGVRHCSWTGFCDYNPIQVAWSDPTMPEECTQKCTLSDQVQKCEFNVTVKP